MGKKNGKYIVCTRGASLLPSCVSMPKFQLISDAAIKTTVKRGSNLAGYKRGRITRFSRGSAARLKKSLALYYLPDSNIYTCTLTFCTKFSSAYLQEHFREFQKYFTVLCHTIKTLKKCPFIWRAELQTSGRPHLHLLVYTPKSLPASDVFLSFNKAWFLVHRRFGLLDDSFLFWADYAVDFQLCKDTDSVKRYQADHMSKHKKSQLGLPGRQWGVMHKAQLRKYDLQEIFEPCRITDIRYNFEVRFQRIVRRYMRYRIRDKRCVFGSRKSASKWISSQFLFVNDSFVTALRRMFGDIVDLYKDLNNLENILVQPNIIQPDLFSSSFDFAFDFSVHKIFQKSSKKLFKKSS